MNPTIDDNNDVNDESSVLATITGVDAKKVLYELERDSCFRFRVTEDKEKNNDGEPIIELLKE